MKKNLLKNVTWQTMVGAGVISAFGGVLVSAAGWSVLGLVVVVTGICVMYRGLFKLVNSL